MGVSVACKKAPPNSLSSDSSKSTSSSQEKIYEGTIGDGGYEPPTLAFQILKIYPHRKLMAQAPFHTNGGDWTFLDCQITQSKDLTFSLGFLTSDGKSIDGNVNFEKAYLIPSNPEHGEKLLSAFAKAFHTSVPQKPDHTEPLSPLELSTAVFGTRLSRSPQGGFSSTPGPWMASKWFFNLDGYSAEVFVNVNLGDQNGEFSEKDSEYREDLLQILAMIFRDGIPKDPTPETDSRLTYQGPSVKDWHRIMETPVHPAGLSADGHWFFYLVPTPQNMFQIYALSIKNPKQVKTLAQTHSQSEAIHCIDPQLSVCLIEDIVPKDPKYWSSRDPKEIFWFDAQKNQKNLLQGPWDPAEIHLSSLPMSENGQYAILDERKLHKTQGKKSQAYHVLHVVRRRDGNLTTLTVPDQNLTPISWIHHGTKLLLAVQAAQGASDSHPSVLLADPNTGLLSPLKEAPKQPDLSLRISPDHTMQADFKHGKTLTVKNLKTGKSKTFLLSPREQRQLGSDADNLYLQWLGNRYLYIGGLPNIAFVNVTTLKMSYLTLPKSTLSHVWIVPDQGTIFVMQQDGLYRGHLLY